MITERHPELVRAAFACGFCLHAPRTIRVSGTPDQRIATVDCSHCGAQTRMDISAEQAALLWELNRQVAYVHFASDAI